MPNRKQAKLNKEMTTSQLAEVLGLEVTVVIKELFKFGLMRTVSMIVDMESARKIAISLGYEIEE